MGQKRYEEVAGVVAALSRSTGTTLDPTSILQRTMAVLEEVIDVQRLTLWHTTLDGAELVASHPPGPGGSSDDLGALVHERGATTIPIERRGQPFGHLVALGAAGEELGRDERALLAIAANQIAGALERAELFREVMELERLKTDFIARVSHELRTPITIINGFLETLIAHGGDIERERRMHMLERSLTASARLGHLIEELLVLSRLEGGVITPASTPVAVEEVLAEVRSTSADPDRVTLTGPAVVVETDAALLQSALGFVVDNALKYGGSAEVATRRDGDRCTVEVRDEGPGFADDIRATAFEMFTRSQSVATVPGLGAGLAIARTIVEVLDGSITLGDHPSGVGAVVRISLPA